MKGFEGERARIMRVKTSQCDVFSERVDGSLALNTPQQAKRKFSQDESSFTPTKYGGLAQQVRALA